MAEVKFLTSDGGSTATKEVDLDSLGTAVRLRVMRQAVISYESNKRQGTRSTRTRGEVRGARRKLWRQKGTGRARVGDRKTSQRRGGGTVFGPKPQDFSGTIPRKIRRAALRSAVLSKFRDGEAALFELPNLETPRTKAVVGLLKGLGIESSTLFVTAEINPTFYRSARNIPRVAVRPQSDLNALEVLRYDHLVIEEKAMTSLAARLSDGRAE